jgi:hypothetical protein
LPEKVHGVATGRQRIGRGWGLPTVTGLFWNPD